jgi:hypothetical protein
VVDDNVRVTLVTHFGLRTEAVKPPEVVGAWRELLRERRVDISGMDFEPTPNGRLQLVDEVQVSRAALQELIVKRATQVTTFLRERPELRAFD